LKGWDIVIVARKGLGDVENPELHEHFGKLWKRLARSRPVPTVNAVSEGVDSQNA
jgi:ribonuclease P protein component